MKEIEHGNMLTAEIDGTIELSVTRPGK